ncbi:MAG: hypothetical protein RJA36_2687 [Pseudomonadota bacterium]|jgi:HK97 family phage portal protein
MFALRDLRAARGPDDDFWFNPIGGATASGVSVTSETALRLSTVYKCVRVRAETIGMLPLQIYRRRDDGGKEAATDHPLYPLLHDQPNPWQTSMQWRQLMQSHVDLRGNGYSRIVTAGNGRPDMLLPLHPDLVKVEILPNGMPRYRVRPRNGGGEDVLLPGEVLHLAGLSADGYTGMNPIECEREAIGAGIAARDYGAAYFKNGAKSPMWIKFPGRFKDNDARRKWMADFAAAYGGQNTGRTPVLENGMELQSIPLSNVDAQFIESRKYSDTDIAGLFRVPPHKLGILDRATWGNIEHQQLDFVTDAVLPSCVMWEQTLLRDLDFGEGYFAELKVDMLLRGDTKTRYEAYGKGIQDGWLLRNEARRMENLNPLDGLDEPLQPMNMATAGAQPSRAPATPGAERRMLIAAAAARRAARKEAAMLRKGQAFDAEHVRWLGEVLCMPADALEENLSDMLAANPTADDDFVDARSAELLRLALED